MIRVVEHPSRGLVVVYRVLMGVVFLLIFLLLGGTLYTLVSRGPAAFRGGGSIPPGGEVSAGGGDVAGVFTGIGRVRALTAEPQAASVILSVTFPYVPEDRAFSEELAAKTGRFRDITAEYFASFSAEELRAKEDGVIKEELRRRYNAVLSLGSVSRLYFNDFMIIE
jgi:flagellar basal body-associated protein FliL